ncbi:MAG: Ig-like domain-containing protein [Armatimonadetes bacterium]|nr:Ig-like domain-containing protein [Armatimonadota bacterium]
MINCKLHRFCAYAALVATLSGCAGSSSSASATGQATMTITWPDQSRLIPEASNSINVSLWQGTTVIASKTVARPTSSSQSTLSFTGLPSGTLTLVAQAFPSTDGSGVAQASATQSVTITAGSTTSVTVTMASTITTLSVSPSTVSLDPGYTQSLTATAFDSTGATVLISASTLTWASSDTSVATVDSLGVVTAVASGSATITATETESGKTATSAVTVSGTGGANVTVK